jgi:hypothetical protein
VSSPTVDLRTTVRRPVLATNVASVAAALAALAAVLALLIPVAPVAEAPVRALEPWAP